MWGPALVGIVRKAVGKVIHPLFSTGVNLSMGWLIVVAVEPLLATVPAAGLVWLLAGGLFCTAGVAFHATDSRLRFGHLIWHLFVMAGTDCRFAAVLGYAA